MHIPIQVRCARNHKDSNMLFCPHDSSHRYHIDEAHEHFKVSLVTKFWSIGHSTVVSIYLSFHFSGDLSFLLSYRTDILSFNLCFFRYAKAARLKRSSEPPEIGSLFSMAICRLLWFSDPKRLPVSCDFWSKKHVTKMEISLFFHIFSWLFHFQSNKILTRRTTMTGATCQPAKTAATGQPGPLRILVVKVTLVKGLCTFAH